MTQTDWIQTAHTWLAGNLPSGTSDIPVFDCNGLVVNVRPLAQTAVLCRSTRLDQALAAITDVVRADYGSGVEGMLYCLYVREGEHPVPVYVGIARAIGQSGAPSAFFANARRKPRFDDYDGYHIGDLSTQVVPGHAKPKAYKKVWADRLFSNAPSMTPLLRTPVYFWGKAWTPSDVSAATCLGHTPLFVEESLLTHAFRAAFLRKLLNA